MFGISSDRYEALRAVEDSGRRSSQEAIHVILEIERIAQVEQLSERRRMKGKGDLDGYRLRPARRGIGLDRRALRQPRGRGCRPGEAKPRQARPGLGRRRRLDLGRGQEVGKGVEVVADTDPTLGARLERDRATSGERIEHDVAGPAVAGDEGVGERRREARQVRAHRMERVTPQPLLRLPFGLDPEARQVGRQLEIELTGCEARGPARR